MLLELVKGHCQEELGDALICKGVGHDVHSFEVETDLLMILE